MSRRPLRFISAISLLIFVLVLALWVRSKWVLDGVDEIVTMPSRKFDIGARSAQGRVWLSIGAYPQIAGRWRLNWPKHFADGDSDRAGINLQGFRAGLQFRGWLRADFGWAAYRNIFLPGTPMASNVRLLAPDWFVALLASLLPLRWMVIRTRIRRLRESAQCVQCGYDLRASPDRCPECGAPVAGCSKPCAPG
ncbi:MAG TPA: hypothetical protein VFW23_05780 [Tepidisphaeraceae bacterium]|nr:hypothetical protein [Tepidisphaeraceae bacterium]